MSEMEPIYLDYAATTPVRPEVRDAMAPYLTEQFGNPNSSHSWGRQARAALEDARDRVAGILGAGHEEIVFTGCGTEADNIAVLGRWRALRRAASGSAAAGAVVCSAIEHSAVLNAARAAAAEGATLVILGVDEDGRVDPDALDEALPRRPAVVSVMWGNNEVGTIQPVAELGARCREAGVAFHTDAIQAFGKVPVRVDRTPCDMLSLSAHKFGGPKATGVLYVRREIELLPVTFGGGQERGLRPGTQAVASAVGLAVAAELAAGEQAAERRRMEALRERLEAGLRGFVPELRINGGGERLPHVLNVSIPGADQATLLMALDLEGVAVSGGSACHSGAVEPSHVLLALGRPVQGEASVRFSLGRTTTPAQIEAALERARRALQQVREAAA